MYKLQHTKDYLAVVDCTGDIVETFDFNEYREAELLLNELNAPKVLNISYLIAKAKWISRNGKKVFAPIEEFRREFLSIEAGTLEEAQRLLGIKHRASAILRDFRAE